MTFQPDRGRDEGTYPYLGTPVEDVTLRSFYYGFTKTFKEILIEELRSFFETNPVAICFQKDGLSTIHVVEAWGQDKQYFPAVIIERTDANLQDLFLGKKEGGLFIDQGQGNLKLVGERLGGRIRINAGLKLGAFSTPQRDALSDLILYGLVGPIHWNMTSAGFPQIPNSATIGPEAVEEPERIGASLYTRTVSFSVEGEWYHDFYHNGVDIQGFNIVLEKIQA